MSLFVINRYEGEKEVESKHEKKHLSELLKRIEERKRERATKTKDVVSLDVQEDLENSEEPVRKKKKKRKDTVNENSAIEDNLNKDINESITHAHETISDDLQKLHKKKKKKRKDVQSEESANVESEASCNKEESLQNLDINNEQNHLAVGSLDSNNIQEKQQRSGFTILGSQSHKKKHEVKRVLPDWLMYPEIISADLNSGPSLEELDSILDRKFIHILKSNGITKLFPVQASIISWLSKCSKDRKQGWWLRDTCVSAPTGSGKTLAYVLPIVQELQHRLVPKIRCLIVVPVQELASQVHKVMAMYTSDTSLKVGLLSGASSFEQEQNNILKKTGRGEYMYKVDIIVATPGRLIDHILKTPGFSLADLRFLVIDEADRASDWLQYLPEPHYRAPRLTLMNLHSSKIPAQKLLFSATLSQDPEKLNRLGLFQPILFTSVVVSGKDDDVNLDKEVGNFVGRYTSPGELKELAVECTAEYKPVALYQIITKTDAASKTLVFTNSGYTAHRLALLLQSFLLEQKISVGELSAQLVPKQREIVLNKFAVGEIQILISSDALARGLDIPNVQLVVSYDVPKHIKGYIHRAGRTGRAGKSGTAISIVTSNQVGMFKHMLNNAHKTVPDIEKLELDSTVAAINYNNHVEKLRDILEKEKQDSLQQAKAVKRMRPNLSG